ncbi:hypothetical protein AB0L13_40520 [Saccharopolyspora shandongensis]|uniref:hypothetical protein n=1 Tax=Saccharopolyspora shandongensis TaxID=418495 RepID=UPI0034393790
MTDDSMHLTTSALDWFGGLPVPPGVGDNTGWAPPASWDTATGGLVDADGNPITPTDPEPPTYPPSDAEPAPDPPTDPETGA